MASRFNSIAFHRWFKYAGNILVFGIPILVGIVQFGNEQASRDRSEFQRMLWQAKMQLYNKTAASVGRIMSGQNGNGEQVNAAIAEFTTLYWGEMYLNEDSMVHASMTAFKNELSQHTYPLTTEEDANRLIAAAKCLLLDLRKSARTELDQLEKSGE